MPKRFQSILVPIDFTINTEVAVSKALELLQDHPGEIHLLHVKSIELPGLLERVCGILGMKISEQSEISLIGADEKLNRLKNIIELRHHQIKITIWLSSGGPVESTICQTATRLGVDLIVIGKRTNLSWFPAITNVVSSRIAAASGIAVLTVKPGSMNKTIRTVVIPIDIEYPAAKLEILEAFRHESMNIRLAVFTDSNKDSLTTGMSLVSTFRILRIQSANPVNYDVLTGKNRARALLKYCSKVDADVLIASPGIETRIGLWKNQHISDLLPAESRMQVLAVNPC